MHALNDVHQQFAEYFKITALKPYAYLLSKKLSEGHTCLQLDQLDPEKEALPAFYQLAPDGAAALKQVPIVGQDGNTDFPFVLSQNRLYLQRYYRYESSILEHIRQFLQAEQAVQAERLTLLEQHQDFISSLFAPSEGTAASIEEDNTNWQLAAAITGILHNFTIITGGPGTGKTTTVAKLLAVLYTTAPELKVALAAPTGKAAARMAESLRNTKSGLPETILERFRSLAPSTLHRLLKPVSGTPYFKHDHSNPLNYDVVIVDECSMIDIALFAKLLDAIAPTTRLILLGDKDQLASVEAGSLFGDLCLSLPALNLFTADRQALINKYIGHDWQLIANAHITTDTSHPLVNHLVELRRSHRFTGHTGIGQFSKAVIRNEPAILERFLVKNHDEQVQVDENYSADLFYRFVSGYAAYIHEPDERTALRLMNNLRVLCAIREGEQGLHVLNARIEKYLHDRKLINVHGTFYENRPIILTRNYYEHGLFNGDTGILRRTQEEGILMAYFEDSEGNMKTVMPGYLSEAETAFVMTIHKSQGSEFREVLVVLPAAADNPLLTRELVYTGVTRAREKVYIQGSAATLLAAAGKGAERASGIITRFSKES